MRVCTFDPFIRALLTCLLIAACERSPAATRAAPSASVAQSGAPAASPAIPVQVHVAIPRALAVTVSATGTLLARESVEIVPELNRRLIRIHAKEGQTVKQGALLYELDSSELRAEIAVLDVDAAQAKREVERQTALLQERITTVAEQELAQAKLAAVQARRNAVAVTLSKTQIRAPFAGTLGLRRVSEGAWVSPNTVITTLEDLSRLKVDFTLPERYSPELKIGETFRVHVAGQSRSFEGQVVAIESRVTAATRSIVVRGLLSDSEGLRPGNFAKIELPLAIHDALTVPAIALISSVEGRSVFVVDEQNIVRVVKVDVGQRDADVVEITTGLEPGARVVTTNLLRMREGVKVEIVPGAALGAIGP